MGSYRKTIRRSIPEFAALRIAYVTHYFPPAGFAASENTYRIVKGLAERGHELIVFCPQTFSKYTMAAVMQRSDSPFEVHRSLPTPLPLSTTLPHLFNFLRVFRSQYDLVITQFHLFHLASLSGFMLKVLKGKPWIVRVHDMIPDATIPNPFFEQILINSSYGALLKNIGKKADRLLVLTNELRGLLAENGHSPSKVAVVPNGVDTKTFCPPTFKDDSSVQKSILYVGSLNPEDGVDRLIKAFSCIAKRNGCSVVIIGDGPERSPLIELVKKLNIKRRVTFYRYVPHDSISEFIKQSYFTVGPLRFSPINAYTIPSKILEYFACGKPVVSSPVSRDILIDEFNGLVAREVNPETIAEKFSILLEDEKLAALMGKNARQLVVEKFDWEKILNQIEKEVLNLGSRGPN